METEKKVIYTYQLSLANGKILINDMDGLFSIDNPEKPEEKVLVNSAVLIKVTQVQPEEDAVPVTEVAQDAICVDDDCNDCKE
jgi:hypothetical protein